MTCHVQYTLQPYTLAMPSLPLIHANQNCHEFDEPIHDFIDDSHTNIESLGAYPNKRNVNKRLDYIIILLRSLRSLLHRDRDLGNNERTLEHRVS